MYHLLAGFRHLLPLSLVLPSWFSLWLLKMPCAAMLLPPGAVPSLSLGGLQHGGCSLVISEDPGVASHIVLELCTIVHGPTPRLRLTETRHLDHRLAKRFQDICQKLFEVEFLGAIDVVAAASFGELYQCFGTLSETAPLGLAHSTF